MGVWGLCPQRRSRGQSPRWGVRGRSPPDAGSILAAEGPLEKAFCLFLGEFRTLETTRLDGSYLHCDLITVGYIEIRKVSYLCISATQLDAILYPTVGQAKSE